MFCSFSLKKEKKGCRQTTQSIKGPPDDGIQKDPKLTSIFCCTAQGDCLHGCIFSWHNWAIRVTLMHYIYLLFITGR